MHGYTDSSTFGGLNTQENGGGNERYSWLYGKTHWEMSYEIQCNEKDLGTSRCSESYFGLKFRRPLKFNNNHNPPTPFVKLIYARNQAGLEASIVTANSMFPYEMNEDPLDTNAITSPGLFYSYNTDTPFNFFVSNK